VVSVIKVVLVMKFVKLESVNVPKALSVMANVSTSKATEEIAVDAVFYVGHVRTAYFWEGKHLPVTKLSLVQRICANVMQRGDVVVLPIVTVDLVQEDTVFLVHAILNAQESLSVTE